MERGGESMSGGEEVGWVRPEQSGEWALKYVLG